LASNTSRAWESAIASNATGVTGIASDEIATPSFFGACWRRDVSLVSVIFFARNVVLLINFLHIVVDF
jgi:hypothetical protein